MTHTLIKTALLLCGLAFVAHAQGVNAAFPELGATGDRFTFLINPDPQMGPRDSQARNERLLYALLADFVEEANAQAPAFTLYNGDMVAFARPAYFDAFVELAQRHVHPVLLVHGNHDGRHPGEDFQDMQAALGAPRALWYSFDVGAWHFAVIPGKEQLPTPAAEDALLDWLGADLAANANRPTMLFVHYHLLPVGLSQSEYYTLSMDLRRAIIDTATRHGNVRHVISGHVHAGVQASVKSSWTWRGTNFLVAPSPVSPRNFGEEYAAFQEGGGPARGGFYLQVDIDGEHATFIARKIGSDARFTYPDRFQPYEDAHDRRALTPVGELPAAPNLVNADFAAGFTGWQRPHRYQTDVEPGFRWHVLEEADGARGAAVALHVREKGRAWAYDEFLEQYQLIALTEGDRPALRARYRIPLEGHSYFGGGYLRATAYRDGAPQAMWWFHWGAREERVRHLPQAVLYSDHGAQRGIRQLHRLAEEGRALFWRVPDFPNRWQSLSADLAALYDEAHASEAAFAALRADKLLVAFGVWCGMEPGSHSGAWFDAVHVEREPGAESRAGGRPLRAGPYTREAPYSTWYLRGFDK